MTEDWVAHTMWRAWLKIRLMPMWERLRGTFPFINNSMSLSTHDFTFRIFHLILLNTGWVMAYYRKLLKAELWARRESAVLSKWAVTKQSLEHKLSLSICLGAKTKFSWCHYYSCGDGQHHSRAQFTLCNIFPYITSSVCFGQLTHDTSVPAPGT